MADQVGGFSGNPQTEWLDEPGPDRRMRLLVEFTYVGRDGAVWRAPAGSVVDGASIPPALWSTVGSPYTGDYRRASIVHDVACDDPHVPRATADAMFFEACLAGGCAPAQARLLYIGVRIGAWLPSVRVWADHATADAVLAQEAVEPPLADQSIRTTFREIAADVQERGPDLSFRELELIVDQHLAAKAQQP